MILVEIQEKFVVIMKKVRTIAKKYYNILHFNEVPS